MAEDESDVVASLIAEKLEIIKNGRPTPELELKEKVKKVERHFKTDNYQRYPWMTGCKKTNMAVLLELFTLAQVKGQTL